MNDKKVEFNLPLEFITALDEGGLADIDSVELTGQAAESFFAEIKNQNYKIQTFTTDKGVKMYTILDPSDENESHCISITLSPDTPIEPEEPVITPEDKSIPEDNSTSQVDAYQQERQENLDIKNALAHDSNKNEPEDNATSQGDANQQEQNDEFDIENSSAMEKEDLNVNYDDTPSSNNQNQPNTEDSILLSGVGFRSASDISDKDVNFNSQDVVTIMNNINDIIGETESIKILIDDCVNSFTTMNEDVLNELNNQSINSDTIRDELTNYLNSLTNALENKRGNLKKKYNIDVGNDDDKKGETGAPTSITLISSRGSSGSSGGHSSSSSNKVEAIVSTPTTPISENILKAIVGTVTFTEIVALYENIGSQSTVQSSLTGHYNLIDLVKHEGKYYYRILDKDTNKIYYVEVKDGIKVETNVKDLIEINEPAMMLTTAEVGDGNFAKLAEVNNLYFVHDKVENSGIEFAHVIDGNDGNNYYIPVTSEVSLTTLDAVTNSGLEVNSNVK